jgi:hypothetical protein
MDSEEGILIFNTASLAFCVMLLINSITYYYILNMKGNDNINIVLQFIGIVNCIIFEIGLLLINTEYVADQPQLEAFILDIPWLIFLNSYFIVFYRQSDILLPRPLFYFCWVYLAAINAAGCYDTYLYYMEYVVSEEDYFDTANLMDVIMSLMFIFIEFVVNLYIVVRVFNKVRHQSNRQYKILIAKLCSVLFLYFCLDVLLMTLDITNNQMMACFFWGINYGFKIQMEALCLGKIREVIIIMENYQNA